MNIRPLYDRIVVKRLDNDAEKTASGLFIPDSAKEKPQEGEVIAVGQGKRADDGKLMPLDVKVGDRILFGKYSGSDIKMDGNEYLIMREDEVLGVIDVAAAKETKKKEGGFHQGPRRFEPWQQNKLFIARMPARRSC